MAAVEAYRQEQPVAPRTRGISAHALRHNEMRRQVVKAHPEVVALAGPEWKSAVAAAGLLAAQWTVAWAVSGTNVWLVFLAAFCVGQFVIHAAGALVHESAHRLVFRGPRAKLAFDLLIEAVFTSFSRQLTYQHNHITSHHPHLGDYEGDYEHEDICRFFARRKFHLEHPAAQRALTVLFMVLHFLPLGFLVEFMLLPKIYARLYGLAPRDPARDTGATRPAVGERLIFIGMSLAVWAALYSLFGFWSLLYQVWSLSLFSGRAGITAVGQFLSEHPGDDHDAPTRSTYWWGNLFLFNIGYHVEHHTFPNVAWTRLPRLRKAAPEVFNLANERSYLRFWWDHIRADFDIAIRRSDLQSQDQTARCHARAA